jgi:hypothetical protein
MNMSDRIVLSRDGVTVTFDGARRDATGWLENFWVTLETTGLNATARVWNPAFGTSPNQFFADIVQSWRGWEGEKAWSSIEGELTLIGTSDNLGHIFIEIRLRPDSYPAVWNTTINFLLDAGQLEPVSRQFDRFFAFEPK